MCYNGFEDEPEYVGEYIADAELAFYRAQANEVEKNRQARRDALADRMKFTAAQVDAIAGTLANWGINPVAVGRALERWEQGSEAEEGTVLAICFRAFAEHQRLETEGH